MTEGDTSTEFDQPRPEHELWLAMQAAHTQWIEASSALEALTLCAPGDALSPDDSRRIARASEEQQIAFQEYIEARLTFSEFLLSRTSGTGTTPGGGERSEPWFEETAQSSWIVRKATKLALLALTLVILCPAGFGLTYLIQARQHVRDLEAARDAVNALLSQARSQTAARKPDIGSSPMPVAIEPHPLMPADKGRWKPAGAPPAQSKRTGPTVMRRPALDQFGQPVQRRTFEFTLAPSSRYASVGPVKVSLHNLDQKHKCFDLSVVLGDFRLEKKHVRLYEPVVINVGGSAPVRLVADRIGRNEVHGSLSRPQAKAAPASWRQTGSGSSTHSKALAAAAESRQPHGGFPTTTP